MKPFDLLCLVTLGALWDGSFIFMRVAAPEFGPVALISLRVGIAALVLLPLLAIGGRWKIVLEHAGAMLFIGILNSALPFTLFAFATLTLEAGYSSVINSVTPLFTALVAWLWLRETLGRAALLGMSVGLIGVFVLVSAKLQGLQGEAGMAILAALIAACSYGVAANYTRARLGNVGSMELAAGTLLGASLLMVLPGILYWPSEPVSTGAWLAVASLGFACTGFAYVLFFYLINSLRPSRAVTVTYLVPVSGMVLGAKLLMR